MKNAQKWSAVAMIALSCPVLASETISYAYDSEGRLVSTARSGTINSGVISAQTYDKADNRTNLTITGSANSGGGNQPPVAVNDSASFACNEGGAVYVLNNDSDPEGGTLTITSVSVVSGPATATFVNNTPTTNSVVAITAGNHSTSTVFSYAISDGQGGTASATINFTPSGARNGPNSYTGTCPP